jgi:NADH-quinone oxidoreductase subunit N
LIILTTITAFALMPTHALESVRDFMHAEGAAFLPELELLLFACGILAMDFWISQKEKYWSPALALAGLLFSALTLWMLRARIAAGAEFAAVHDTILVDTYFLFFSALLLGASAMIILLSVNETAISLSRKARYYALLLFACAALMLAVSAVDLLVMFLALEVAALSCFFLTALPGISKRPESLSVKFMLSSLFGSAILIYGFSLLYGLSGATNIGKIASALARRHNVAKVIALSQQSGSHGAQMYQLLQSRLPEALHWHPFMLETLPMAAFLLVLFGLLAKIKAASVHHVDENSTSASPLTPVLFLSGALVIAAIAVLLRLTLTIFADSHDIWWRVVAAVAVAFIAAGVIASLRQKRFSRILAYASIAQIGYILLALVAGDETALTAMAYYLFSYLFIVTGAFAILLAVRNSSSAVAQPSSFNGLGARSPVAAVLLLVFMIALAGFPPTAIFFARYSLFQSLLHNHHRYIAWIAAFAALPLAWCYLRIAMQAWRRNADPGSEVVAASFGAPEAIVLGICAFVSLAAGLYSEPFLRMARYAFGQ